MPVFSECSPVNTRNAKEALSLVPNTLLTIRDEDLLYQPFCLSPCSKEPALAQQNQTEHVHTPKFTACTFIILAPHKCAAAAKSLQLCPTL